MYSKAQIYPLFGFLWPVVIDFIGNTNEPDAEILQLVYFVEWYFPCYFLLTVQCNCVPYFFYFVVLN